MRVFCLLAVLLVPVELTAGPDLTSDKVKFNYYLVTADTLAALSDEMDRTGPDGYWAFTRTKWDWDAACNMQFGATINLPRLGPGAALGAADRSVFDRMLVALTAHEMEHVAIGRNWAKAIKAAGCPADTSAIDAIHGDADAVLDVRTDHGRLTGVTLEH